MNAVVVFAVTVAILGVVLFETACRARRPLEAGITAGAITVCVLLAVAAGQPVIPLWLVLLAVWLLVVLVGLAAWSLIRAREKARTGEGAR